MSRYPYTYACDYLRGHVDDYDEVLGSRVTTLSRSQASQAIGALAKALGMEKEALAGRLADAFLRDQVTEATSETSQGEQSHD